MKQIKNRDKFGHRAHLFFNNSYTHKTFCRGLLSISINIFMMVYIYSNLKKWIEMEDDSIQSIIKRIDTND